MLGLGQDVLRVENNDQYAGHRAGEGEEEERESMVFTAAIPHFLSLTATLMFP